MMIEDDDILLHLILPQQNKDEKEEDVLIENIVDGSFNINDIRDNFDVDCNPEDRKNEIY
jgi:hypothetical protein